MGFVESSAADVEREFSSSATHWVAAASRPKLSGKITFTKNKMPAISQTGSGSPPPLLLQYSLFHQHPLIFKNFSDIFQARAWFCDCRFLQLYILKASLRQVPPDLV